jgi:hypothetical protein
MDINGEDFLRFQVKRAVTTLFKQYLILLEELGENHDEAMARFDENLPEEYRKYINLADYLNQDQSDRLRKKVLDIGNETIRNLEEVVNRLDVRFK